MTDLVDRLRSARILAILRLDDVETKGVEVALRLHGIGVRAIECTLDRPGAITAIQRLRDELGTTLVGGGTVTDPEQVDALIKAGADFCVTPHLDRSLVTYSLGRGMPMIPGIMTPSELAAALRLGTPAVKLFPAGLLGVEYLKALRGPFGSFPVIPTGSITVDDVPSWLGAGATCVGLGSALTETEEIPDTLMEVLSQ